MSWNTLSATQVIAEFNATEKASLVSAAGGADNLAEIVADVVGKVRGVCLAGGNQVEAGATIPDQLREEAKDYARWKLLCSYPKLLNLQTAERKELYEDARDMLKLVAEGTIKVELPLVPLALETPLNGFELASGILPRLITRTTLEGL